MMMPLPEKKSATLEQIVHDLQQVNNVRAIVLGGSHCMGMATEKSDLDIGIYYEEKTPFAIEDIRRVAGKYSVAGIPTVTGFYEWGAWVNGGAWIDTASGEVDFIYRNLEQVRTTINNAISGIWQTDFAQQPPYGFSSVIYLAETYYCQPLYDPHGTIAPLKEAVASYPPKLKQAIVQQSLWAAQFALWQADKMAARHDTYNTAGCLTRIVKNITDALYALNETYPMGDKTAMQQLAGFAVCPSNIVEQITDVLTISPAMLTARTAQLRSLFEQVIGKAGGLYRPYFQL